MKVKTMECFIVENGVERKAGLEDILPLLDDRLIQYSLGNAYKTIYLPNVLAGMPDEIKNIVYRNLSIRIHGKIKEDVKKIEPVHEENYGYFENERKKLISFIGENINTIYGSPDRLIWKETKPKEKTRANLIEELIKAIENACASKSLYLPYYADEMSKEDVENAFAAFHDRKDELQKIRSLTIGARDLPAASPLFENGTVETLVIVGEFTGTWPEFLENCGNLTSINLDVYKGLTEFPSWLQNAVSLRELSISYLSKITYIPDWIGDLQSLTEIIIYNENFKTLPDGIGNLKNLAQLAIHNSDIEKLPDSIGGLSSLKELDLSWNEKLSSLPDTIGNLTNLTNLTINNSAIEKLPDSIGNLSSLKELYLYSNKRLTSLPDSIGNLKNLENFVLCDSAVRILPDSIGNLQNLTDISLDGTEIEKLPDSIGNLEKLTRLDLANSKKLKCLPDSVGKLKNLASLILSGSAIDELPDTLANCTSLECVDVCDTGFTSLPKFISSVKNLKQSKKLMPEKRGISYPSFCNYYYTLVGTIFRFNEKARREGILALEDELEDFSEDFFKTGIRLLIDGTDGVIIRDILTLKIEHEHDYYIKKLMETAMEGILGIQNGDNLPLIGIRLASLVDIKNNRLETACAKYLAGDFKAFDNFDFMDALQPEGEREEIRFIKRALEISEMSRRNGLLEIDKYLDKDGIAAKDVFEYGLPMIIDNWDFNDRDKILSLLAARETDPVRKNLALAKKNALRMIAEGCNTRVLLVTLAAYFDDEVTKECMAEL